MAASVKRSDPATPRDEWFDRLARNAARSMSRRDAIGFIGGVAVMAMVPSWMRPSRIVAVTPRAGGDPGCDGTRTFYRVDCANPVPKLPPYKPAINGCGPQNGFNPVPQSPLYLATFTSACDEHDRGYGTCKRPKDVTDLKFLVDMKAICVKQYPTAGFFADLFLVQCLKSAETYYAAVSEFSAGPYQEGQSEGCDCCDECPGGQPKCNGQCCPKDFVCHGNGEPYGAANAKNEVCPMMCMRAKDVQYVNKICR